MSTRIVLGSIGAAIGFIYGGPQGAYWGFSIGATIGGVVDPEIIKGPSLGEIGQQTSQEGGPRPIVFLRSPPMAGNVIASGPPKIVKNKKRQGKGGPKVETESVYRTYAIGICEGEISGLRRVWRNNVLVYDVSGVPQVSDEDNEAFLEKVKLFPGNFTQNPSPDLEALFGVGTTPAHRGTAYVVVVDEDLTDLRGAIPQWIFQVGTPVGASRIVYDAVGTFTWNKPLGLEHIEVTAIGGGGGGASGGISGSTEAGRTGGEGGGGGGRSSTTIAADLLGATETVTVGASGDGGINTSITVSAIQPGVQGGDSSFGVHVVAGGGYGGADGTINHGKGGSGNQDDGGQGGIGGGASGTTPGTVGESRSEAPGGGGGGGGAFQSTNEPTAGGTGGSGSVGSGGGPWAGGIGGAGGSPAQNGAAGATPTEDWPFDGGAGGGGGGGGGIQFSALRSEGGSGGNGTEPGGGGGGGGAATSDYVGPPTAAGSGGIGGHGRVVVDHFFTASDPDCMQLADIVTAICERAGLPASLIDVTQLEACVRGFVVTNNYPAFTALRSLGEIYLFDPSPRNGKVVFVTRGGNSVALITEEDMVETGVEDLVEVETNRNDPIGVPRVLNLLYYDIDGGLAADKQSSERAGDRRAVGESTLQSPVIMDADQAAKAIAINHKIAVENQKGLLKFSLSDRFIGLAVADPIIVQYRGRSVRVRIDALDCYDGYQSYKLAYDRQSAYVSNAEGIPAAPQTPPVSGLVGPTLIEFLDIHILQDVDDTFGLIYYIALSGIKPAWQGALVELSVDGGENYIDAGSSSAETIIGELLTELPDHSAEIPDEVHSFDVLIKTADAELVSATFAEMLNRQNLAIVGEELINFSSVAETSPGIWTINGALLRGRKGSSTESHPVGTRFVMLDRGVITLVAAGTNYLSKNLTFRATSFGGNSDEANVITVRYDGKSQVERAPAYLDVHVEGDEALATWQGVGRLGGGAFAAHGQYFQNYHVVVRDNTTTAEFDTTAQSLTIDLSGFDADNFFVSVQQNNLLTGLGAAAWWPFDPNGSSGTDSNAYLELLGKEHPFIDLIFIDREYFNGFYIDTMQADYSAAVYKFPSDATAYSQNTGALAIGLRPIAVVKIPTDNEHLFVVAQDAYEPIARLKKLNVSTGIVQEDYEYISGDLKYHGGFLYATHSYEIQKIDPETLDVVALIPVGSGLNPIRWVLNTGDEFWFTGSNGADDVIAKININTGSILFSFEPSRRLPMGSVLYGAHLYVYSVNNQSPYPPEFPAYVIAKYQVSDGAEVDVFPNPDIGGPQSVINVWFREHYMAVDLAPAHQVFDLLTETFL